MPFSKRHCAYMIGLLENEIKELQSLIQEIHAGNADLAAPIAERSIAGAGEPEQQHPEPDQPQPERRRGRKPKAEETKPKRELKVKNLSKKTYFARQHHITAILKDSGEPMTPFRIKEKLLEQFNISVTDQALGAVLKQGLKKELLCCPQQGEYAIPN